MRSIVLGIVLACCACGEPPRPAVPPLTVATPATHPSSTGPGFPEEKTMTRKMDLVENLHGMAVADPYRWLEDGESPEVRAWTDRENYTTRQILDAIPGREKLKTEALDLLQIGHVGAPAVRTTKTGASRYFHTKREGAQNQPTLYVRDGVAGKDRVLLDVSSLSEDGTTSLDWWFPSRDGDLMAWGRSESGSEESTLYVRDVATGKELPDRIEHTRYASVAWMPDGKSFYYSRHPEPGSVPAGDEKYWKKIFLHVLGTDPKTDKLVYERQDKTDVPACMVTPNGRWLVIRVHMGWDKSEVFVKDLAKGESSPWVAIAEKIHAIFEPIGRNDRLYIQTNDGAPRYKLYAVDWEKPQRANWKELIPEGKDVLDEVAILKNEIVSTYMHDASTRVERFGLDGKSRGAIALPGIGTANLAGAWDGEEVFASFTSYVVPFQVLREDLRAPGAKLETWDRVGAKFSADDIDVQRLYATSKDGTKVPMFVIAKKGFERNGKNPTVLYGYGGFNVNQTPAFSARALTSVRHGAVWVTTILRGGGELGEDWHKAGMLEKKQNVFDDYHACAQKLFDEKITTPDKLGIVGGSNGGLLVATAVTQHPEMFRVGLSLVPLTDMIRYHRFRIAKLWIPEYGDPDKAADFRWLYAYSPYHHVKDGVRYPAMLFTTAESDSRVDPMHARKMTARMQEVQKDPTRPILVRVETKAGHGAGKPVSKVAEELADELSFLLHELGVAI